jgi:hypothetical protein
MSCTKRKGKKRDIFYFKQKVTVGKYYTAGNKHESNIYCKASHARASLTVSCTSLHSLCDLLINHHLNPLINLLICVGKSA